MTTPIPFVYAVPSQLKVELFAELCEQRVTLGDYPHAVDVRNNVLIYSGDKLRSLETKDKAALMSELHLALAEGPGVVMIRGAYEDTDVIDRHTAVFERILRDEEAAGGGADHFAQAGANSRIWNSLQKAAQYDADSFVEYYANPVLALVCEAWLGPWYQMTAQVNVVRPGGQAQQPHRDYHLGFQEEAEVARFPLPVQRFSQLLTLQGAVAHSDMPVESGPTKLLPFSQQFAGGYLAWRRREFIDYFESHAVQLPLAKGDALFFSPALFHAAGSNVTVKHFRTANLLLVASAFAKPMESVDRIHLVQQIYNVLSARYREGSLRDAELEAVIAAAADGYPFPTNLDVDPPIAGLAPQTQQQLLRLAVCEGWSTDRFYDSLLRQKTKRKA